MDRNSEKRSPSISSSRRMSKEIHEKAPTLYAAPFDIPTMVKPRPGGYLKIPKEPFVYAKNVTPVVTLEACRCNEEEICEELECEARPLMAGSPSVIDPTPDKGFKFALPKQNTTTRSFRIQQALEESYKHDHSTINESFFDQTMGQDVNESALRGSTINILAIVVSTIMLLSSNSRVADEMLDATVDYLKLVKDHEGNTPPNIQGLFNQIMLMRGETPPKIVKPSHKSGSRQGGTPNRPSVLVASKAKKIDF